MPFLLDGSSDFNDGARLTGDCLEATSARSFSPSASLDHPPGRMAALHPPCDVLPVAFGDIGLIRGVDYFWGIQSMRAVLPSPRFAAGLQWGLLHLAGNPWQALLSTCPETYSEETSMKRPRVPYARRSVWAVIAVLSVVLVLGFVIAGYEINHLQNEVNGLQNQVTFFQQLVKTK